MYIKIWGVNMIVSELIKILSGFPEDEEVTVLYPEDHYGEDVGVTISEVAYITGTNRIRKGVYIKLD